jgi:hypothetical protein
VRATTLRAIPDTGSDLLGVRWSIPSETLAPRFTREHKRVSRPGGIESGSEQSATRPPKTRTLLAPTARLHAGEFTSCEPSAGSPIVAAGSVRYENEPRDPGAHESSSRAFSGTVGARATAVRSVCRLAPVGAQVRAIVSPNQVDVAPKTLHNHARWLLAAMSRRCRIVLALREWGQARLGELERLGERLDERLDHRRVDLRTGERRSSASAASSVIPLR